MMQNIGKITLGLLLAGLAVWLLIPGLSLAADPQVLKPRVPADQMDEVRAWTNPLPATSENIEKGKEIFHGKGFCVTCHGREGTGLGNIPGLRGPLPRNFTDTSWQAARTDGELMWILKNGSPGTAMASFVPRIFSEQEAWHVILYLRSFGRQ